MARLSRIAPAGVPQHIIQRGNNRQVRFVGEADMKAYLHWIVENELKTSHSQSPALGPTQGLRIHNHRELVNSPVTDDLLKKTGRISIRV